MIDLYRNIKNKRLELGLSQDELARLTGYTSRSSIAKIEKGKVDLSESKIGQFAEALHTTRTELMGLNDTGMTPEDEEDEREELYDIYRKLNSTNKSFIQDMILRLIADQEKEKSD